MNKRHQKNPLRKSAESDVLSPKDNLEENAAERTRQFTSINEKLQQEINEHKIAEDALWKAIKRAEEEKAKSEAIIAAVGDGIVIQDTHFRIMYQNQIHKDLVGDHSGKHCYLAYSLGEHICKDCPMEMTFRDGSIHTSHRRIAVAQGFREIAMTASPLRNSAGDIVAGIGVIRDITDQIKMEDELRDHRDHLDFMVKERTAELIKVNKELRTEIMRRIQMEKDLIESQRFVHRITDATPNILYLYDVVENRIVYVNPQIYDILGYMPDAVKKMGRTFIESVLHPDDSKTFESLRQRFNHAKDGEIIEVEYRMKNSSGEWRWFYSRDVIFKRTRDGLLKLVLGIAQDITSRKKTGEELRESREQLRKLLAHVQSVREDERTRISREIHDELGQSLTALKMDISWIIRRLAKDQEQIRDKASAMSRLINDNIQTVKRISAELRPGLLDDLGLTAALEWQANEFQERTGIRCEVLLSPEDIILDRDISTVIFRVFQETLTNVARHAKAKKVTVSLTRTKDSISLQVRDDGRGIEERQISSPKSIGLIGMKERVHFFGGKVAIRGCKDLGTTVDVCIPFSETADAGT
ncbi:MAG: PAS domain S-box protein [Nitrospirae bacterium]|nr:PAS domain S-box protein [Nitrospirota bacterium]